MEVNPSVNVKYVIKYVVAAYDSDMLLSHIFIILDMSHLHMLIIYFTFCGHVKCGIVYSIPLYYIVHYI